jgi:hypothetical protein
VRAPPNTRTRARALGGVVRSALTLRTLSSCFALLRARACTRAAPPRCMRRRRAATRASS